MLSQFLTFQTRTCSRIIRRAFSSSLPEAFIQPLQSSPDIACLHLNRPQTKNAISRRMLQVVLVPSHPYYLGVLTLSRNSKNAFIPPSSTKGTIRVLIVRSTSPNAFCAGADLAERRTMSSMDINKFLADLRSTLGQLEALPMPTIAAIDGPALGGGLELSFACDLRVAGHGVTKIGLPETRLGIIPGAGGTQRAVRLLGLAKAKDLIFTARMLTATEAHTWGVVDYVSAAPSTGYDRALELAMDIAKGGELLAV
ncbi:hypothetical protein ID866_1860 [Astraeus odoratus]|nr:hypothetical protein ID866_1860 [Astraeus odoratus]